LLLRSVSRGVSARRLLDRASALRRARAGERRPRAAWSVLTAVLVLVGRAAPSVALVALSVAPVVAAAQQPGRAPATAGVASPTAAFATRGQLSQALAAAERRGARDDAARIRTRLAAGDFRAGDRLAVTLTVDSTRQLELVVRDSQRVEVAPLGDVYLRGVLRSEAQPVMLRFFQRYYRSPEVRVQPLLRVGFLGAVGKPAYYSVPPDVPVADALVSAAGGAAPNADLGRIEIRRGNERVVDRKGYTRAARDGLTFSDLDVRSGDEVRVPEKKRRDTFQIVQVAFFAISALTSLLFLVRAFYNN
jgi:protein involved in polysaccharide export with SLBB domain